MLSNGNAARTQSNYTGHWNRFIRFCGLYGVCALPTSEEILGKYAAYRFNTTTNTADSFKNELYGIKDAHTDIGYALDVSMAGMPRLAKIRRGWKRERKDGFREMNPITSNILKKYLRILCDGSYDHQTLRALLCLAKFGVLRVSEYSYGKGGNAPQVKDCMVIPDMDNPMYLKQISMGRKKRWYVFANALVPALYMRS